MKWSVKSPGGKRNQGTSCDWCSCDLVSWSPTALWLLPPNAHSFEAFLSAKTESCDGNYKTVGHNFSASIVKLISLPPHVHSSSFLCNNSHNDLSGDTWKANVCHDTSSHTHTHCDACEHTWDAYTLDWARIDTWQDLHVLQCILTHTAAQPPRNFFIIMYMYVCMYHHH